MTSHGSRFTQSTKSGDRSSSSSEQNDIKRLKSKYGSHLSTLRELFPDWSDDDLLFAIQDADGDLEVAIDRISEGLVSQWDEVKTKKSKKEAKATTASSTITSPPLPSTQQQYQKAERHPQRGSSDRARRGGRGGSNNGPNVATSRVPKQTSNHTATWAPATAALSRTSDSLGGSGSWAAVAKKNAADVRGTSISTQEATGSSSWDEPAATTGSTGGGWDTAEPEVEPDKTIDTDGPSSSEQPKTWASLLKSKPKTEHDTQKQQQEQVNAPKSEWDTPAPAATTTTTSGDGWGASDNTQEVTEETSAWDEPAATEMNKLDASRTASAADSWTSTEPKTTKEEPGAPKETEPLPVETETETDTATATPAETSQETISTTRKITTTTSRRLKQDVPVVLPDTGASISSIGVKFGSLSLDEGSVGETIQVAETSETVSELREEPVLEQRFGAATAESLKPQPQQQQQPVESVPAPTAAPQSQAQQAPTHYLQQQQQSGYPQQPHLLGIDQQVSGYNNSYHTSQPPTNVSGFGINPMASLPDYGIYGADAHRAAMGYYDQSAYSHSPSASSYQAARDKDSAGHAPSAAAAAQHMYPNSLNYYPYYYMPNQFGYQQPTYGQPFMNKSMYPNMYGHSAAASTGAKPTAGASGSAASPYSSPYTQNMYGGYEDMSGLQQQQQQHHLSGLQDYQRLYQQQQQLPNFLGSAGQQQQQQQQQQQTPLSQQGQTTGAAGVAAGGPQSGAGGAGDKSGSNGQQPQHQQQQQGFQQAMNPNNYFSHYQQHYYQQPSSGQQQHQQQQSPMGRQQPYWSQ